MGAMMKATLLFAVAIPVAVSALILVVALMLVKRSSERTQAVFVACAAAFGYAAGHFAISRWPGFPPVDATNWLMFVAPLLFIPVLFAGRMTRTILAALFAGALVGLVLKPLIGRAPIKALMIPLAGAVGFAVAHCGEQLSVRRGPFLSALALEVAAIFACITLLMSGSAVLGQFGAAVAAALGPVWVYPLIAGRFTGANQRNMAYTAGVGGVFAVLLCGLAAGGYFYASLHWASALLMLLALPAGAVASRLLRNRTGQGSAVKDLLIEVAVIIGPVALMGIAAFVVALITSPPLEGME